MRRRAEASFAALAAALTLAAALALPAAGQEAPARGPHDVVFELNVMVPMRDGVLLSTDVYRPAGEGRHPVILTRNPYSNGSRGGTAVGDGELYASHGYVYLHQDVRGRFDSEGGWYPFAAEARDGYDAVEWAAAQPWSNGRVGMRGLSYLAYDQWLAAATRPPHLVALAPSFSPLDLYDDIHPGGAFEITRIVWAMLMNGRTTQGFDFDWDAGLRHLPVLTMDEWFGRRSAWWRDLVVHADRDSYWQPFDMRSRLSDVAVPVLHVGGWFDAFLRSTLNAYTGMKQHGATREARRHQRLIIGPWPHGSLGRKAGDVDFGEAAARSLEVLELAWFERRLKASGSDLDEQPSVELFVMGENRWRRFDAWPPPQARAERWYLRGGEGAAAAGRLAPESPGDENADRFVYDPADPVPTRGGALPGASPDIRPGSFDQSEIEARSDVLVYTSAPLEADLTVIGPVEVVLHAASSAPDTDFTAKLVDVHPDGRAYNLTDGIIRARYRASTERPSPIVPGRVYEYRIDLAATANTFRRGHRVRLEISSSNFPRYGRNPNTGGDIGTESELVPATQTIHHGRNRPSHVVLHVIRE